jgi:DNA-binding beta-propeller fold protein YncE
MRNATKHGFRTVLVVVALSTAFLLAAAVPALAQDGSGQQTEQQSEQSAQEQGQSVPPDRPPEVVTLDYRDGTMARYERALSSYLKRDFDRAEELAKDVIEYEPDCIEAKWLLANIYHKTDRLGRMIEVTKDLAIREATESRYAFNIVQRGAKGYIVSVDDDLITVDLLARDGAEKGRELVVYEEGAVRRHPVTLEIVSVDQPVQATAEILQVFDNYSVARITEQVEPVSRGMRAGFESEFEDFLYQQQLQEAGESSQAQEATSRQEGPTFGAVDLNEEYDGSTLTDPEGFATSGGAGRFIADTGNHRVVKLGSDGSFAGAMGTQGSGEQQFQQPVDAELFQGQLVIVERGNHRLHVLDTELNQQRIVGSRGIDAPGRFNSPTKAVSYDGQLYVLDSGNQRVQVFDQELNPTDTQYSSDQLQDLPTSFTVIPNEYLVVVDYMGGKVLYFDFDQTESVAKIEELPTELAGSSISDVTYALVNDTPVLAYTLDRTHQVALVQAETQELITTIGTQGADSGEFNQPIQVEGSEDRLIVLERKNNRLQVIRNIQ